MAGFEMSEWISRPPKEVFDFITSSDNAPKVVQSVKSMVSRSMPMPIPAAGGKP